MAGVVSNSYSRRGVEPPERHTQKSPSLDCATAHSHSAAFCANASALSNILISID
jgi:hypothetical protein